MCHTWYFGDHPEDHYQVDSEWGDMGELNMIMENVINIACHTFIKMPAHMEEEFREMRTITLGLRSAPQSLKFKKKMGNNYGFQVHLLTD